uniref:E3 ubiquitin protein ligase n=1 Tax=Kalanchoe fedtschenkoi TaxID=63787 RepID=A0A7N0UF77_KALFE
MESGDSDGPEKKRPHLISPMERSATNAPASNSEPIEAGVLQYQNQKLVQQLDMQKNEMLDLEAKIKELLDKQNTYDDILMSTNRIWNQLVDDLVLFGVEAGGDPSSLSSLHQMDNVRGLVPSCPPEEIFLRRLLQVDPETEKNYKGLEEALNMRYSSSRELMTFLQETIDAQERKASSLAQALYENPSSKDTICKIEEMFKEEANNLHEVINAIHLKHKQYADEIQSYIQLHSVDQIEIKRLAGDLEESMSELEESRRKFINLKMQKDAAAGVYVPVPGTVNGSLSPEKAADKLKGSRELKDSIDETKMLAASRLSELQEVQEDNIALLKQVQDLENELKDDKFVYTSRPYNVLKDQLQHWNAEGERYKGLTESLQADRSNVIRRDKELKAKAEAADVARSSMDCVESKLGELKLQLKNHINENNELEIKIEEAVQDSGRKDIKAEFSVMASALSREMKMMEAQLNRWQDTAEEAISLREKSLSLHALVISKATEQKNIADQCAKQMVEIKSLKENIGRLQMEKLELQLILDMYAQENLENNRDLKEIKESESRALSQSKALQNALDEHSLELRVRAANEAELACQQRLSAAEAEKNDLWEKLDASDRELMELTEAIKIKDAEAETYIAEIETIGQAYEDMQTQNQRLLQQIAERDEYNIKLVSESVKTKQSYANLLSEKQALTKQLLQVNTALESVKLRITRSEDQMKILLADAKKSSQEDRHLAISLETARWELADAEKELKWLKSAVASSEKEYEQIQRKTRDAQVDLENERNERKRLEEELMEMNQKVAELTAATGEAAIQKLKDEIKECKSILKCGVCSDRPKEVVITKCYHLFCHTCIQKNIETRHRKCPGCGTAFGQSDVRFVKI